MADSPPPPHSSPPKSNLPMLYYGLVVVGTAALVLVIYNLIIVRWCARHYRDQSREEGMIRTIHNATTRRNHHRSPGGSSNISLVSSFRYKKGGDSKDKLAYDSECSVCLSGFEEGEEVRQLPTCKHSFHASCIDMWLYSHSDCPLCRAAVGPQPVVVLSRPSTTTDTSSSQLVEEHSREGLLDPSIGR